MKGRPKGSKTKPLRKAKKFSDERIAHALSLLRSGVPPSTVARDIGCSPAAITQLKKRFSVLLTDPELLKDFREVRADAIDALQITVLKSMNEAASARGKKAPTLQHTAYAYKVLHEASRLEHGLSTKNIEQHVFHRVDLGAYSDPQPPETSVTALLDPTTKAN